MAVIYKPSLLNDFKGDGKRARQWGGRSNLRWLRSKATECGAMHPPSGLSIHINARVKGPFMEKTGSRTRSPAEGTPGSHFQPSPAQLDSLGEGV